MNVSEAISHLKRLGWHVSKEGENYRAHKIGHKKYCISPAWVVGPETDYTIYSPRELIHLANSQSAMPRSNTSIKKKSKSAKSKKNAELCAIPSQQVTLTKLTRFLRISWTICGTMTKSYDS